MANKAFEVGDKVRWSSQAAGSWTKKVGVVVAKVPPGKLPKDVIPFDVGAHRTAIDPRSIGGRGCESYVVLVRKKTGRALPVLYWPVTSKLELAGSEE